MEGVVIVRNTRNRGYEGLGPHQRADFSSYLQGLRERAKLSQGGLADVADSRACDVGRKAVAYFEGHPAEPFSHARRRLQLAAICRTLAERVGENPAEVLAKVNRLGGGVG